MTTKTRTSVASICRYSAMPPQTPAMTRLVVLRSRRVGMCVFPSLKERVDDRHAERGEEAERDDRLGRDLGHRLEQRGEGDHSVERQHDDAVDDVRRERDEERPDPSRREAA